MINETAVYYLLDLGNLIKASALDARDRRDKSSMGADHDFESGRLAAYYEVITLMQQQAAAFGIELGDVALDNVDPDRDLV